MILVVTRKSDAHGAHMIELFRRNGEDALALDYEFYPQETEVSFRSTSKGEEVLLQLPEGKKVAGAAVKSVLNRRQAEPRAPDTIGDKRIVDYIVRESKNFLDALPQMLNCFWLSNPDSIRLAGRKPYHLAVARRLGFQTPRTLITNSPCEAEQFTMSLRGDVAAKALWTPGITLEHDGNELGIMLYTQRLERTDVLKGAQSVRNCPMILQEYIEKAFELRITIVGTQVFACAIYSQQSDRTKEDWHRYDLANTPHEAYRLPPEVEVQCVRLVETLQLSFGCIDMIVTPGGEYVFLEINPNGQWLWIEHLTGLPISQAIAELLANPPDRR